MSCLHRDIVPVVALLLGMRHQRDDGQPNDSPKGEEGRDAWQVVVSHGSLVKAAVVLLGNID